MTQVPVVKEKVSCSFCGTGQDDAAMLVAGPHDLFICDECIAMCMLPFARNHTELFEEAVTQAVAEANSGARW